MTELLIGTRKGLFVLDGDPVRPIDADANAAAPAAPAAQAR